MHNLNNLIADEVVDTCFLAFLKVVIKPLWNYNYSAYKNECFYCKLSTISFYMTIHSENILVKECCQIVSEPERQRARLQTERPWENVKPEESNFN